MSILATQATFEYVIAIKVSSLKGIYFTFAPQDWTPVESFHQTDYICALASKASATGARIMKTTWFWNNVANYRFFLDGKPTPASPVNVRIGFSENISELARELHFRHKSADGNYLRLLEVNGTYMEQNLCWDKSLNLSVRKDLLLRVVSTL